MNDQAFFKDYLALTTEAITELDTKLLTKAANLLLDAYNQGKVVFTIGNGGSAGTASHMACDLSKTVRGHKGDAKWPGFKSISLSDNVGLITAWGNDTAYDHVYSGQLENLGQKGDVLVAISSSGNSANIIKCVEVAKRLGMKVIGISGFKGGKLKDLSDVAIVTSHEHYGPVEDIQLIVNHALTNFFIEKFKETHANS